MSTVLGLIGFVLYVAAVIGLAAGVTWLVVWLLPQRETGRPSAGASGRERTRGRTAWCRALHGRVVKRQALRIRRRASAPRAR